MMKTIGISFAIGLLAVAAPRAHAQAPAVGLEVEFQGAKIVRASGGPLQAAHELAYGLVVARSDSVAGATSGFHPGVGTYERTIQLTLDGCTYDKDEPPDAAGKRVADICDMEVVTGPAEAVHWDDMRAALKCWNATVEADWSKEKAETILDSKGKPLAGAFIPLARFLTAYDQCVDQRLGTRAATWEIGDQLDDRAYFALDAQRYLATHVNFGVPLETIAKPEFLRTFAHANGVPPQYASDADRVVDVWARAQKAAAELVDYASSTFKGIKNARPWKKAALQGLFTYWFAANGMDYYWKDVHVNMLRQRAHVVAAGVQRFLPELYDVFDRMDEQVYQTFASAFPERIAEIEKLSQDKTLEPKYKTLAEQQVRQSWLWTMSGQDTVTAGKFVHTGKPMDRLEDLYARVLIGGWPGVVFENRIGDLHLGFTPVDGTDPLYAQMKQLLIELGAKDKLTGA